MLADSNLAAEVHKRLLAHYDVDRWHWRPETPPLDICLGAILVQHTSWANVEKAMANLHGMPELSPATLLTLSLDELAALVRPAGTPLTKAVRLQAFARLVVEHGGFEGLFEQPTPELRRLLLATTGIGPETADVILLYAARRPVVVHDAYTARLHRRLGEGPEGDRYEDWRGWLDTTLPHDLDYRMRDHAAIVIHSKELCRAVPKCGLCPLLDLCPHGRSVMNGALPETAPSRKDPSKVAAVLDPSP
jgi:endonuclease-3 related protein